MLSLALIVALLVSHPLRPGDHIDHFSVQAMDGSSVEDSIFQGHVVVVGFISTRCPISNAFNYRMNKLYREFGSRVTFLFVDSNVNESADEIREHARAMGYDFPVYKDVGNTAADALGAESIAETFLIDSAGIVRYRGNIEDSPNPDRVKVRGLRLAIEATLADRAVPVPETHVRGCAIRRRKTGLP